MTLKESFDKWLEVSVPIRGLFYLTKEIELEKEKELEASVP